MPDRATTKKHILSCLTKRSPLTGRELGQKMDDKRPGNGYSDARTFGRALGELVGEGAVTKHLPASRPKYTKA